MSVIVVAAFAGTTTSAVGQPAPAPAPAPPVPPAPPAPPLADPWALPAPPAPPVPPAPPAPPGAVSAPLAAAEPAPVAEPAPGPSPAPASRRPGAAFGLGVGIETSPFRLDNGINATSMRFRFDSGTTLEPSVVLVRSSTTDRDGMTELISTWSGVAVRVAVRHPIRVRGPMELSLIAGLAVSRYSGEGDRVDDDTTATSVALQAGVGLDYWFNRSWAASMSVVDPFVQYAKYAGEQVLNHRSLSFGIELQIGAMMHLYF